MNITATQLGLAILVVAIMVVSRMAPRTLWQSIEAPLAYALGIFVVGFLLVWGGPKAVQYFGSKGGGLIGVASDAGLSSLSVTSSPYAESAPPAGQPQYTAPPQPTPQSSGDATTAGGGGSPMAVSPVPMASNAYTDTLKASLYGQLDAAWQKGDKVAGDRLVVQLLGIDGSDPIALSARDDIARARAMANSLRQLAGQPSFPAWLSGQFLVLDIGAVAFRRTENEVTRLMNETPGWTWGEEFTVKRLAVSQLLPSLGTGDRFELVDGKLANE